MDNPISGLEKPLLFVGIGNSLKADDAAGVEFVEKLQKKGTSHLLLDCGEMPENYIKKIASFAPKTVVFVDAMHAAENPGNIKLIDTETITNVNVSTHGMPLSMLAEIISIETGAKVYILGIQAKTLAFGQPMSQEVSSAIDSLVEAVD
jgi:hydrogenase 3 maturation protease